MDTASQGPLPTGWRPRTSFNEDRDRDAPWTTAQIAKDAGVVGLLVGLGVGLFVVGLMSLDHFARQDVPVERAVVTHQSISVTKRVPCGKAVWANTHARITTFSVDQPREGFPATFSVTGCGRGLRGGETVWLQRRPGGTEDDLMLGGWLTAADIAQIGVAFAGLGSAATFVSVLVVGVVRPRWQGWVAAGRAQAR